MGGQPDEVLHVEGQDALDRMDLADGDEPDIVDLLADNAGGLHDGLPGGEDVWGFRQEGEAVLEPGDKRVSVDGRLPQAVGGPWPGGRVAQFDQALRRYVQDLALPVEFDDGVMRWTPLSKPKTLSS